MKTPLFLFFLLVNGFLVVSQNEKDSTKEVYFAKEFRFELEHFFESCSECNSCFCKEVVVYDLNNRLIFYQTINDDIHTTETIARMDVYDFNFDGYPDFRLVNSRVYFDQYFIFNPEVSSFYLDPVLSELINVQVISETSELVGFKFGTIGLESKNTKIGPDLNNHQYHFKGKNLENLTIESKVWYNPWNGPAFYEDTIRPKYLHSRTCTYKDFVIEQVGEEVITEANFTLFPTNSDAINQRIQGNNIGYRIPKITYKEELPSNYYLYRDRARDTLIDGKKYGWVVYDLNKNPFEIGENYENGIKNGEWIKRDQHGRISSIENYINDTLMGFSSYFYYENYPWNVTKISGFNVNGTKVGEWNFYHNGKFQSVNDKKWLKVRTDCFDRNGKLLSISMPESEGEPAYTQFFDERGRTIWWVFYDKNGKITKEIRDFQPLKRLDKR